MCKAFSYIVTKKDVFWEFGHDSHEYFIEKYNLKDDTADPDKLTFARVEIVPLNGNYLEPNDWVLKIDQRIIPSWWSDKHEKWAYTAKDKWVKKLNKILVRKPIINPFNIKASIVGLEEIALLKKWDSVWASVWASVGASVRDSVGASVWDSVRDSVWASVGASVWASVGASVRDSVGASVRDSVWAYTGSFFVLPKWKYVDNAKGYPFESVVKLWERGFVPSFDGKTWRLHAGPKAKIVYEITKEKLNAM